MMGSREYQNSEHLQKEVALLKAKAPGLERYGRSKELIKSLRSDIAEHEHYMRDTLEDLRRLKIRSKFLMKMLDATSEGSPSVTASQNVGPFGRYYTPPSSASARDSDSSISLRSRLRDADFFKMRTNSFV